MRTSFQKEYLQLMKLTSAIFVAMVFLGTMHPANAAPLAAKVGYFNLKMVESKDPDIVTSNPETAEAAQKLQAASLSLRNEIRTELPPEILN